MTEFASNPMVGRVFTSNDREPPPGTVVRDDSGQQWVRYKTGEDSWKPSEGSGSESWAEVAGTGNSGPATVLEWGEEPPAAFAASQARGPYGTLADDQLAQVIAAIVDPTGQTTDAAQRAQNIIRLVRANTTCIGDMNRGCY